VARAAKSRRSTGSGRKSTARGKRGGKPVRAILRRVAPWLLAPVVLVFLLILLFSFANPPTTHTMWREARRLGEVEQQWVGINAVAPVMLRSVVAAEDANFCEHWGFDMAAIRNALDNNARFGGSTISQQTVKNVFLWQDRSWLRKAMEGVITPVVETVWSKRRILEVYLNVAEFGEGVFGIEAAAWRHFRVAPANLSAQQAALLAAVLPNPKERSASNPSAYVRRRAARIADGAATIRKDGRASCFED
tara:strand:- start:739 stop:1485 length:747 start_codon:yes stop_codon:yes gene_type:complete